MDSAALRSLTPLLDGIDKWNELAPLLPVIISLELILSADNAIALASITKRLNNIELQSTALNFGISLSLFFRVIIILTANILLDIWIIKIFAGIYLLSIFYQKVISQRAEEDKIPDEQDPSVSSSLLKTVLLLALTDLAFSIDSVAAAVAISDQFLLVFIGAIIGVLALRFTSGLFIKWLEEFPRLELAGYIAVGIVGLKLIILTLFSPLHVPEYSVFLFITILFIWGFSKKSVVN